MHTGRSIDTLCFVIEGNLRGTQLNLFMVRSLTATRDVSAPARHTSTDFLLCIFSPNAQITLNDLRELRPCLPHEAAPIAGPPSRLRSPREMKTTRRKASGFLFFFFPPIYKSSHLRTLFHSLGLPQGYNALTNVRVFVRAGSGRGSQEVALT